MYRGCSTGYLHTYEHFGGYRFHGNDGFNDAPFDTKPVDVHDVIKEEPAWSAVHRLVKENQGTNCNI